MRRTATTLALLSLAAGVARAGTWTVDDDGPADFPGVAEAIASASVLPGDTLLVAPGTYAGFELTKRLDILGPPAATFLAGPITVRDVPGFVLTGALTPTLRIERVRGRGLVDRCQVAGFAVDPSGYGFYSIASTRIEDCGELLLQHSAFSGWDACYPDGPTEAGPAVVIARSTVTVDLSAFQGGAGAGAQCSEHYPTAGAGLVVAEGSWVMLASCSAVGGIGPFGSSQPAVDVHGSEVTVRGWSLDQLVATAPAEALALDATSTVRVSGVTLTPPTLPPGVIVVDPPEPMLRVQGGSSPGTYLVVQSHAPVGSGAHLAFSRGTGLWTPVRRLGDLLWLDPAGLHPFAFALGSGQELPTAFTWPVPATTDVIGMTFTIQALVTAPVGSASGPWLTNATQVMVGP